MDDKLLIIEDDVNILYGLQAKFSVSGFSVVAMTSGSIEEIINKIKAYRPNHIILDLIMPNIDGYELLAQIKRDPEISQIPTFIFTDVSTRDRKGEIMSLGADHFFIKQDFMIDDFVSKVEKIIKNTKANLKK